MSTRAYRVRGTTSDVTTCELCGREDLRGTVALAVLDAEGNDTGETVHYGSDCGARAAGWTQADMRRRTATADRDAAAAELAERTARADAAAAAYDGWLLARYGVAQPAHLHAAHKADPSIPKPLEALRIYRAELAAA